MSEYNSVLKTAWVGTNLYSYSDTHEFYSWVMSITHTHSEHYSKPREWVYICAHTHILMSNEYYPYPFGTLLCAACGWQVLQPGSCLLARVWIEWRAFDADHDHDPSELCPTGRRVVKDSCIFRPTNSSHPEKIEPTQCVREGARLGRKDWCNCTHWVSNKYHLKPLEWLWWLYFQFSQRNSTCYRQSELFRRTLPTDCVASRFGILWDSKTFELKCSAGAVTVVRWKSTLGELNST